jgi:hypothetical protein
MSSHNLTRTGTGASLRVLALAAAGLLLPAPARASSLAVNAGARYFGAFGLQVQVSAAAPAYVEDETPSGERRYRSRFYVNANGLTMASGDEFELFTAYSTTGTRQFSILLGRSGTQNRIRLAARRDDGVFVETPAGQETPLPAEWHTVEIEFRVATSPTQSDGVLSLVVDGSGRPGLSGLENDQAQVGMVRWGAVAALEAGTTGSFILDEFDSRRDTYIGALSVFQDVPLAHPLWRFVHSLYNAGVTSGCANGMYCPDSSVTREQMAVFLLRSKEGSQYVPAACTTAPFNDVPVSSPFCRWIRELVARGITGGCGNGNFCPGAPVTREVMSAFLLVTKEGAAYVPPACTTPPFNDVPVSSPFCRWIKELVNRGITSGCGGGNFCPAGAVTRGSMAVFLATTFTLTVPLP